MSGLSGYGDEIILAPVATYYVPILPRGDRVILYLLAVESHFAVPLRTSDCQTLSAFVVT